MREMQEHQQCWDPPRHYDLAHSTSNTNTMESSSTHTELLLAAEEAASIDTTDDSTNDDDDAIQSARSAKRASRPSVQECLGVPKNEMANIELDVYNMFYISNLWSQPFFYSIAVLGTKMSLYIILAIDLQDANNYPFQQKKEGVQVKLIVMMAQFFLIPVAIMIQEELM